MLQDGPYWVSEGKWLAKEGPIAFGRNIMFPSRSGLPSAGTSQWYVRSVSVAQLWKTYNNYSDW